MRSRLVELRRARWVALGALAVGLGGAFAPAIAQDAELGLRGATEMVADAAPPLTQSAPLQTPDAATAAPAIAPPVDGAADANAEGRQSRPRPIATKLPALKPYPGAQRLGLRGGPADPQAKTPRADGRRAADSAAAQGRRRRKAVRSDRRLRRRSQADALCRRGRRLGLQSRPEPPGRIAAAPSRRPKRASALQSDWSRSDLHGQLKGAYTDYFDDSNANSPTASGTLDGRYDASRDLSFDAEGRFNVSEQTLTSLGLGSGTGVDLASAGLDLWRDARRRAEVRRPDPGAACDIRPHHLRERRDRRPRQRRFQRLGPARPRLLSAERSDLALRRTRRRHPPLRFRGRLQRLRPQFRRLAGGRRRDARLHPPTDRRSELWLRRARLRRPAPAEFRRPGDRRVADLVGDAADHGDGESADDARRFGRRGRLGRR